MSRIVVKFGGSSVGDHTNFFDEDHMIKIGNLVRNLKSQGHDIIIVISAMAGATRFLKKMCMSIDSTKTNSLEDDLVLTIGEQVSTGLLCKLLNSEKFNLKSQPFLGWQLPIETDTVYGSATITKINTDKLEYCISNDIIPVVSGYQGINKDGCLTTLGFDGSDTSAVAIAGALKADFCQFYKDVRGVYTANPRRVPKSTKIDTISLNQMYTLSALGARILHPNSLKIAIKNTICLKVLPNFDDSESGTLIANNADSSKIIGITYMEHNQNKITISLVGDHLSSDDEQKIIKVLNQNKIFAEIVDTEFKNSSITVEIGWIEQLDRALQSIHTLYGLDNIEENLEPSFKGEGKQIYLDPAILQSDI